MKHFILMMTGNVWTHNAAFERHEEQ